MILAYLGRRGGGAQFTRHLALAFLKSNQLSNVIIADQNELALAMDLENLPLIKLPISKILHNPIKKILEIKSMVSNLLKIGMPNKILITMVSPYDIFLLPLWWKYRKHLGFIVHDWQWRAGMSPLGWVLTHGFARFASQVVVLSEVVQQQVQKSLPHKDIFQGIHPPFVYPKVSVDSKIGEIQLFHFGRIVESKGIDRMLDLAIYLQNLGQEISVKIYGEGDIRPYQPQLKLIKNYKIENKWIEESEIPTVMASGILCALYRDASQSGVIPLAIAQGIPVIASNVGGICHQVNDQVNGWVVNKFDPESIWNYVQSHPLRHTQISNPQIEWEKLASDLNRFLNSNKD